MTLQSTKWHRPGHSSPVLMLCSPISFWLYGFPGSLLKRGRLFRLVQIFYLSELQFPSSINMLTCYLFYYSNCNSSVFKLNQKQHFTKPTSFRATGSSHYQDQYLFPNVKLPKLMEIGIYNEIKLYTISQFWRHLSHFSWWLNWLCIDLEFTYHTLYFHY